MSRRACSPISIGRSSRKGPGPESRSSAVLLLTAEILVMAEITKVGAQV